MGQDPEQTTASWVHRPWIPIVAGLLAFVITVLAGLLVSADWALRTAEMRTLLTAVYESEAIMEAYQDASIDAVEEHRGATGADQAKLDDELIALAEVANEDLQRAGEVVAGIPILPWHRTILDARDAYLAHNIAWQDYTARVIEDPAELLRDQPLVNSTFEDAQEPLLDAIPQPDLLDLELDVWVIYAPPEETSGEVVSAALSGAMRLVS